MVDAETSDDRYQERFGGFDLNLGLLPTNKSFLQQVFRIRGTSQHPVRDGKQQGLMLIKGFQAIMAHHFRRTACRVRNCRLRSSFESDTALRTIVISAAIHRPLDSAFEATLQDSREFFRKKEPFVILGRTTLLTRPGSRVFCDSFFGRNSTVDKGLPSQEGSGTLPVIEM